MTCLCRCWRRCGRGGQRRRAASDVLAGKGSPFFTAGPVDLLGWWRSAQVGAQAPEGGTRATRQGGELAPAPTDGREGESGQQASSGGAPGLVVSAYAFGAPRARLRPLLRTQNRCSWILAKPGRSGRRTVVYYAVQGSIPGTYNLGCCLPCLALFRSDPDVRRFPVHKPGNAPGCKAASGDRGPVGRHSRRG